MKPVNLKNKNRNTQINTNSTKLSKPGKPNAGNFNMNIMGEKFSGKGISGRQRNKLVKAITNKVGAKNHLIGKSISSLNALSQTLTGAITAAQAMNNESEANKLRIIKNTVDSFMEDISKMTPEQIESLGPILAKMNVPSKFPNRGEPANPSDGTIIL